MSFLPSLTFICTRHGPLRGLTDKFFISPGTFYLITEVYIFLQGKTQ